MKPTWKLIVLKSCNKKTFEDLLEDKCCKQKSEALCVFRSTSISHHKICVSSHFLCCTVLFKCLLIHDCILVCADSVLTAPRSCFGRCSMCSLCTVDSEKRHFSAVSLACH